MKRKGIANALELGSQEKIFTFINGADLALFRRILEGLGRKDFMFQKNGI